MCTSATMTFRHNRLGTHDCARPAESPICPVQKPGSAIVKAIFLFDRSNTVPQSQLRIFDLKLQCRSKYSQYLKLVNV